MPVEPDQAGRRLGVLRQGGGRQEPLEQRKHDTARRFKTEMAATGAFRRRAVPSDALLPKRAERLEGILDRSMARECVLHSIHSSFRGGVAKCLRKSVKIARAEIGDGPIVHAVVR